MSSIQKLIYWSLGSYIVKLYSKGQMKMGSWKVQINTNSYPS